MNNPNGSTVLYGFVWNEVSVGKFDFYAVIKHDADQKPLIYRKALRLVLDQGFIVGMPQEEREREWSILEASCEYELVAEEESEIADLRSELWQVNCDMFELQEANSNLHDTIHDIKATHIDLKRQVSANSKNSSAFKKLEKKVDSLNSSELTLKHKLSMEKSKCLDIGKQLGVVVKSEKKLIAEKTALENQVTKLESDIQHVRHMQGGGAMHGGGQGGAMPYQSQMGGFSSSPYIPTSPYPHQQSNMHMNGGPMYPQNQPSQMQNQTPMHVPMHGGYAAVQYTTRMPMQQPY